MAASLRRELEAGDESNQLAEELQKSADLGINALKEFLPILDTTLEDLRGDIQASEQKQREIVPREEASGS